MKTTIHYAEDLARARKLQTEARALHLPVFPVVSWEAEVMAADGTVMECIRSKSNSYVRNGLNLIARHAAYGYLTGSGYVDGSFAQKTLTGVVYSANPYGGRVCGDGVALVAGESYFSLIAGYGDTAESLDDFVLANLFGDGSAVDQLVPGTTARATTWSNGVKKVLVDISRVFTNAYSASQTLKEIGLVVSCDYDYTTYARNDRFLVLRDVLAAPITLAPGESVLLHYKFEVLY